MLGSILQEMRYGLRQLRKTPGFTLTAVVTLGLGIGAATAVFSLVDAVLLRPLPFAQPERLVSLDTLEHLRGSSGTATGPSDTSYPNFFDWRERAKSFDSLASLQGGAFNFESGNGPARRLAGMLVAADFFRVLGVAPKLGRSFLRAEEQAGNRSVILSHGLWQTAFNGDPAALGKGIRLNDETYFVAGVMPKGFAYPGNPEAELWVTSAAAQEGKNPSGKQRGWNQLDVIGRLAPGVSIEQAHQEMHGIQQNLSVQYPDDNKNSTDVSVVPEMQKVVGDVRRPLHILFAAVCFLLLIACANVAGLLLTRTAARRPELALRSALGATRTEIVRQLLMESLTLSTLGGLFGFGLAAATLRLAPRFLPADLPRIDSLSLNADVFLFALGASLLTGLLFGVLPAWRMSKLDPATALRDNVRSSTAGRGQHRLQSALVVGETALGLILLVGAGLLIRSFDKLMSVDPGFAPQHVLSFRIAMPKKRYEDEKLVQFAQRMQTRLVGVPGVEQATYGYPLPLSGGDMSITFSIDGRPTSPGDEPAARASVVAANFFQAMKMPLKRGRFFTPAEDRGSSPPVVIVNQAFSDRFFPGEATVGKRIKTDIANEDPAPMREIVGVVANVTRMSLSEQPVPEYYVPFAQATLTGPSYAVRVTGDPNAYIDTIRSLVAQQDATLPVYNARPYTDMLAKTTAQQRFQTVLLSAFAGIALLLAALGLYAVLSYMVGQRTMELGLRLALGAQRSDVLSLILKRGLILCVAGLGLGLIASAALTRFLTTLLFGIRGLDLITFTVMTMLLLVISTAACMVPAYRASQLNPNDALRQQ